MLFNRILGGIMHRFEFNPELTTGNEDIDAQLQSLFAMANEVLFSSELDQSPQQFRRAVTFLFSYVEYHFASEELAMIEHSYDSRRFHAAFHDHVRRESRSIAAGLGRKVSLDETRSAIFFMLEDWVVYHVQESDRHLAAFLSEHAPEGTSPKLPGILPLKASGSISPDFDERVLTRASGQA
jgi:hemerythrin-like metal-binding protein